MKIIWHSNAPFCSTGYGNQTGLFAPRLAALGHDVAISAFYGVNGALLNWNGLQIYPGGYHPYGADVLPKHAQAHFGGKLEDGLIITLIDAWVLDADSLSRANVAAWAPVDHEPAPRRVVDFFQKSGATPVAFSKHGEYAFKQAGLSPLYVPHGVDTVAFQPVDQREARGKLGVPESAFLVGMVAANKGYPPRKGFSQGIEAFARFRETHDEAMLYLHTETSGAIQGVNIPALLAAHGVPPESVMLADQYRYQLGFPTEYMREAYSAMDVLLNPAFGEGFGIPMIEAQACGTPVISTAWTAMPEVGAVGWQVGGQRFFTDQGSFMLIPDVGEMVDALQSAYSFGYRERGMARRHALKYDVNKVTAEFWVPVLAELEKNLGARPVLDVEATV